MALSQKLHYTKRINSANNPVWMDGLRIALGLFLFLKGIMFLENSSDLLLLIQEQHNLTELERASAVYSFVHIIGGLMIAFGCLTRLAVLCQIPILMGAVFLVNFNRGFTLQNTELWVSVAVLLLLFFFMVVGPGRYSVDNKILRKQSASPQVQ